MLMQSLSPNETKKCHSHIDLNICYLTVSKIYFGNINDVDWVLFEKQIGDFSLFICRINLNL